MCVYVNMSPVPGELELSVSHQRMDDDFESSLSQHMTHLPSRLEMNACN